MDADLNNYDAEHVCTGHSRMSDKEWREIYHEAWSLYYTPEHMKTLLRRAAATGISMGNLAKYLLSFSTTDRLEKVHPLQGGILRLKHPSERRPGMQNEGSWIFWSRFAWDTLWKHAILAGTIGRLFWWTVVIARDPKASTYMDQALTPVSEDEDEDESFDLFTMTTGGRAAVSHSKKIAGLISMSGTA
jgi:hypothetical protein